jgi:hypothetical protein
MKRSVQLIGAGILMLALVSLATAQSATPVIRLGDWVEVGNEVFMNFIATSDIRFVTTHNYDFEEDTRDRVFTRNPTSSALYSGEGDFTEVETRLGVDMRYQKNLTLQVMAEAQYIMDGNLIDDRHNTSNPGLATSTTGIGRSEENNGFHIERYWIDYAFPQTPLRIRVGADSWDTDQAGLLSDDDPRAAFFLELGQNKEIQIYGAMVWQFESARVGLQNDNDFNYYTFGASYSFRPHKVALDMAYFRDRFSGNSEQGANAGQKFDTFMISPSYTGALGPVRALAQFSAMVGSADGNNFTDCDIAPGFQRCEYDVFAWAAVINIEASLLGGMVRPFVGLIWGSGDDDPRDGDLEGFFTLPAQGEVTALTGNGHMNYLTTSPSVDPVGPAAPARAAFAGGNGQFRHTISGPFSDRLGNATHPGITTTYSNPGTLLIPAGVHIAPVKGHQLSLWYMYVALTDASTLNAAAGVSLNDGDLPFFELYHEVDAAWTWTLNPHFDIRLAGSLMIPAEGVKSIASTQICDGGRPCQGEDLALWGEARFRARF